MDIVVLPFFLLAIAGILGMVDVAMMGDSRSAMGGGNRGTDERSSEESLIPIPPAYGSGNPHL